MRDAQVLIPLMLVIVTRRLTAALSGLIRQCVAEP